MFSETDFWRSRVANLECIYDQLRDPRVKKMASILELTDSAYYPSFRTVFRNVVAGLNTYFLLPPFFNSMSIFLFDHRFLSLGKNWVMSLI